jgi:hypothetical protein
VSYLVGQTVEAKFVALDAAIRLVPSEGGLDLARTEWIKPLGDNSQQLLKVQAVLCCAHLSGGAM